MPALFSISWIEFDELRSQAPRKSFGVISIKESWLHRDISDAELHLEDKVLFRDYRYERRADGLLVYAAKHLTTVLRPLPPDWSSSYCHGALLVGLNHRPDPLQILTICRSPSAYAVTDEKLVSILEYVTALQPECFLLGDLNAPRLVCKRVPPSANFESKLMYTVADLLLTQHVFPNKV